MEAILFSYDTRGLSKTEASKISKELKGYNDKSNKGKYNYNREGLIRKNNGFIVSKSTFIIPEKNSDFIEKLRKKGLNIKKWKIDIKRNHFSH